MKHSPTWHAKQGGKIQEEMLELVPALRGRVSALRNIPHKHDEYVATYNVSVPDVKSIGHAVCRSHGAGSLGDSLDEDYSHHAR